ncbi:MAG: nucleoside hydrolase, partial [Gaiellales bacterium]
HDDAIALLLALASDEVDVLAVTTVAGNQTLDKTTANALRVLELTGRSDIPVAAGLDRPLVRELVVSEWIHGDSGLDGPELVEPTTSPVSEHAVDLLARVAAESERPVTLIPVGPLTNIAVLLARHPAVVESVDRMVLMGGAMGLGNVTPAAEFNVWQDPEAARRVFASELDITMIGLDVTHSALLRSEHADRLRSQGPAGRFVAELLEFFAGRNRDVYRLAGAPIHDAAAVAHVLRDDLITTEFVHVEVDCSWGVGRGRTVVDLHGRTSGDPNTHVGVDIDADAFADFLVERIGRLDRG